MASELKEKEVGLTSAEGPNAQDISERRRLEAAETAEAAVVKDGVRLYPQPTSDPLDPLNWSVWRKHLILGMVMWM